MNKLNKISKIEYIRKLFESRRFALTFVAIILVLLTLAFSGYTQFAYAYIKCGQKPVLIISGIYGDSAYYPADDSSYYGRIDYNARFVCSEEEAKARGIPLDIYSDRATRNKGLIN